MNITDIGASLSLGAVLSKRQLLIVYISMALCLVLPLITVILLVIPEVVWDGALIATMTLADIIMLSFLGVLIYVTVKNSAIRKKIIVWMADAVPLKAYCREIDRDRPGFQPAAVKIQVKFKYNNKKYTRISTAKVFGGLKGYLGTYKKYADKDINILFSPEYDEVMILNCGN